MVAVDTMSSTLEVNTVVVNDPYDEPDSDGPWSELEARRYGALYPSSYLGRYLDIYLHIYHGFCHNNIHTCHHIWPMFFFCQELAYNMPESPDTFVPDVDEAETLTDNAFLA